MTDVIISCLSREPQDPGRHRLTTPRRSPTPVGDSLTSSRCPAATVLHRVVREHLETYTVPTSAVVALDILDVRGRRIRTVERHEMTAGQHVLTWDGRDQQRRPVGVAGWSPRRVPRGGSRTPASV